MNGISFARVGDAIRENEAVLSIDEILDGLQRGLFEELLLFDRRIDDFGEGVLVRGLGGAMEKVFVVLRTLGRRQQQIVAVHDFHAALVFAC